MRQWSTPPWTDPAQADRLVTDSMADMAAGRAVRLGLLRRNWAAGPAEAAAPGLQHR
jgi:hypothetical protein